MKKFLYCHSDGIVELLLIPVVIIFASHFFLTIGILMGYSVMHYHFLNALQFGVISSSITVLGITYMTLDDLFFEIETKLMKIAKGKIPAKIGYVRRLYNTYELFSKLSFGIFQINPYLKSTFEYL